MRDAIQHLSLGLHHLHLAFLGLLVLMLCVIALQVLLAMRARTARMAALQTFDHLVQIEREVHELVDDKRRRDAAGRERIRFYMRAARQMRAAEAPGEGDDGEAGEEAGPAEAEDPEGERGA